MGDLSRPVLTLADLESFDPHAPAGDSKRRFCCPLPGCGDTKRIDAAHRSLELTPATGRWRCYRCAAWGTLREHWPARGPHLSPRAVARRAFGVDRLATVPVPRAPVPHERVRMAENGPGELRQGESSPVTATGAQEPQRGKRPFDWRGVWERAPLAATWPRSREYLERRGIPAGIVSVAGVRATGNWYGRPAVLFPVRDQAGALVAVAGRGLDGADPKARSAGAISAGVFRTVAENQPVSDALAADPLVVCEAPIDALSLAVCGIPAIALNGTHAPAWLPRACAFRAVIVAFDADAAGDTAAAALTPALQGYGARVERWRPAGAKDWNELLSREGAPKLRRFLFDGLAGPLWSAAWQQHERRPSPALSAAIDRADWPAFVHELAAWERALAAADRDGAQPA